jgi:hypothetical protein
MIDRQGGKLIVECDSCPAVLDTETADFQECRDLMVREEWRVSKIAGVWLHGCPKCGKPT